MTCAVRNQDGKCCSSILYVTENIKIMKKLIKKALNILGYDIVHFSKESIGKYPLNDIRLFISQSDPLIFDVGANRGQSIELFSKAYSQARFFCFEPNPDVYSDLEKCISSQIQTFNLALSSAQQSDRKFYVNCSSEMSSFLQLGKDGWGNITSEILVETDTIDNFCEKRSIEHIDLLKIDTQGHDYDVLRGGEKMLSSGRIKLVLCEIIVNEMYRDLPSLAKVYEFLIKQNFLLVTFYPFSYSNNLASWTDGLFIHRSFLSRN